VRFSDRGAGETFDSGDSNRDLHMIQVTRGAQFPMVMVRARLPKPRRYQEQSMPIWMCSLPSSRPVQARAFEKVAIGSAIKITERFGDVFRLQD